MMSVLKAESLEALWSCDWTRRCIGVVVGVGVLYATQKCLRNRRKAKLRAKWNSVGKDVVVLHQFWRGKYCPNLSPFVLKVECFLRLAGIKYVVDMKETFGKRGLCPWITLNGEEIEDSQHIVERLGEQFKVTIDDHLSPERKATLEAVRIMVEEQLFWIVFLWRYYHTRCETFSQSQVYPSWFLRYFFSSLIHRHAQMRAQAQGMARHTLEEQIAMGRKQLEIMNTLLGDRPYFGGDEPCSTDCAVFGFVAQFMWNDTNSPFETLIKDTYPNLGKFCLRMKERVYPDWKKLLNPPQE